MTQSKPRVPDPSRTCYAIIHGLVVLVSKNPDQKSTPCDFKYVAHPQNPPVRSDTTTGLPARVPVYVRDTREISSLKISITIEFPPPQKGHYFKEKTKSKETASPLTVLGIRFVKVLRVVAWHKLLH